jgi:tripartite-type tricarboxylate transporter receptor subunit TctC
MTIRKAFLAALYLLVAASPAIAQEFPTRAVRLVTWAPGTFPDITARMMAEHLKDTWKHPVIVVNRAGVGGVLAAQDGALAPADGYTLVWGDPVGWYLFKKYQQPEKEQFPPDALVPLSLVAEAPLLIAIDPRLPASNLAEFLAYARQQSAQGRPLIFGAGGVLSVHHLSVELLARMTDTKLEFVPYKSPAEVIPAVVAGEVALAISGPAGFSEAMNASRVRALGVTSLKRLETLPDVPAIAETVPNYDISVKPGFYIHKDTPKAVMERISRDLAAAVRAPDVSAMIRRSGAIPIGSTAEEYEAAWKHDIEVLAPVAEAAARK